MPKAFLSLKTHGSMRMILRRQWCLDWSRITGNSRETDLDSKLEGRQRCFCPILKHNYKDKAGRSSFEGSQHWWRVPLIREPLDVFWRNLFNHRYKRIQFILFVHIAVLYFIHKDVDWTDTIAVEIQKQMNGRAWFTRLYGTTSINDEIPIKSPLRSTRVS